MPPDPSPSSGAWEELDRSEAYSTPWFSISRRRLRLPDGPTAEYFVHQTPDSALCVCVTADGRFVMERQYRPALGRFAIDHPAGRLEPDDANPVAAVLRELAEETGYRATSVRALGVVDKDPGFSEARMHLFLVEGEATAVANPEATEDISVVLATPGELLGLLESGELSCVFCVAATHRAFAALGWSTIAIP